ncbi:glycosyltransferase family 4 protein [Lutibacter sp.]
MKKIEIEPIVIMLCTAGRGGMRTVVESYKHDGLFEKWNIQLVHTHDEGSVLKRFNIFIQALVKFMYLILFKKVALIHNHSAMRGSFWRKNVFSTLARMRGIPVILHLHGSEMEKFYYSQVPWGKNKIISILNKADVVMVLSKSWEKFVLKIAPDATVKIVYNYVTPPKITLQKALQESKNDTVNILFLGLIGKRKGVYDLIDAVKKIKVVCDRRFKVLIGGNGEVEELQNLIVENDLQEQVVYLGWVSGEEKESYLRSCDIYILPSYNEGLPMSLLEAMSWGKPVISTRVGGIPELIRDNQDGMIVDAGNVEQISSSLMELIESKEKRRQFGQNSRERIEEKFSDKVVLPQIDALYQHTGNWRKK